MSTRNSARTVATETTLTELASSVATETTLTDLTNETLGVGHNNNFAKTAFGGDLTDIPKQQVWVNFPGGAINTRLYTTRVIGIAPSPAVDFTTRNLVVSSGAAVNTKAVFETRRVLRYILATGSRWFGAGHFDAGVAGNVRIFGIGGVLDGFFFGFDGTTFGVLHKKGGVREVQTLTIATKSSTAENVTVTLDGTAVLVPVTNGAGTTVTAWEISQGDYSGCGTGGWVVYAVDSTVIFIANEARPAIGTFSLVGTTVVGSFVETRVGTGATNHWYYQADWSEGAIPDFNPIQNNVYCISFQWQGEIRFFIENPALGRLICVHKIKYAGTAPTPSVPLPTRTIHASSENSTNNTPVSVYVAAAVAYSEGDDEVQYNTWDLEVSAAAVTTETSVIAFRNDYTSNGCITRSRLELIRLNVYGEGTGNNSVVVRVWRNPTFTTAQNFNLVSGTNTATSYSVVPSAVTTTGATRIYSDKLARNISSTVSLKEINEIAAPGDVIAITVESASSVKPFISLTFREGV